MIAIEETPPQIQRKPTPTEKSMVYDFLRYAPANLKIQTEQGELAPFKLAETQLALDEIAQDIEDITGMVRLVILKARRVYVTTYWAGKFYHNTIHHRNRYSYIITHEPDATDFVFKMVKRFFDNCVWRPTPKYNNTTLLEFNNEAGTGLDSAIRVATANKKDVGSAQLIHNLLLSEMPKYPDGSIEGILNSILQCVPDEKGTRVIMEGTAKGVGGEFPKRFWSARYKYDVFLENGKTKWRRSINPDADVNNKYASVFIPCYVSARYQMDPEPGFERTTYDHLTYGNEQHLVNTYGVNDCFLAWRRHQIVNKCRGSLAVFHQEMPMNAREAFLASGRPVFDPIEKVDERMGDCKPAKAYYTLENRQWVAAKPMAGDTDGILQVWEESAAGEEYVVCADVAEGLEDGDFDSASVLVKRTGRQVAHWHGHTAPDKFGEILYYMGQRYGFGWVAPERNNHGLTTITRLVDMKYPNICPELSAKPGERPRKHYGFLTGNSKTGGKSVIIDEMAALFREHPEYVNCAETCAEMLTFKNKADGSMGAEKGHFDDRVMEFAIGNFVRTRLPRARTPEESGVPTKSSPSASAWS